MNQVIPGAQPSTSSTSCCERNASRARHGTDVSTALGMAKALRRHGQPVSTHLEALRRWNDGQLLFTWHEMDEEPSRVVSLEVLQQTTPDLLLALP